MTYSIETSRATITATWREKYKLIEITVEGKIGGFSIEWFKSLEVASYRFQWLVGNYS